MVQRMDSSLRGIKEIRQLRKRAPLYWANTAYGPAQDALPFLELDMEDMRETCARLDRFKTLLVRLFKELEPTGGCIESPLVPVPRMKENLSHRRLSINGELYVKADHLLPVAGSVKARGGIHEVLFLAEKTAVQEGLLRLEDDHAVLAKEETRKLFGRYTVSVGSTGNLGLGIGIAGAALGFNTVVHLSAEARAWKKELLKTKGVTVIEHASDYSAAVKAGREAAAGDPMTHFVDDERSPLLFLGYAVAALELQRQLDELGVTVDRAHPLFVYIPCGVGGAPGGITFGLKQVYGDAVHCVCAEPVESPCMLLGMLTGLERDISVYDIGLENKTIADGLAVSRPSRIAGRILKHLAAGFCTVTDVELLSSLAALGRTENMRIEPSAAAGFSALEHVISCEAPLRVFLGTDPLSVNSTHIVWSTGGGLVPDEEYRAYTARINGLIV